MDTMAFIKSIVFRVILTNELHYKVKITFPSFYTDRLRNSITIIVGIG